MDRNPRLDLQRALAPDVQSVAQPMSDTPTPNLTPEEMLQAMVIMKQEIHNLYEVAESLVTAYPKLLDRLETVEAVLVSVVQAFAKGASDGEPKPTTPAPGMYL